MLSNYFTLLQVARLIHHHCAGSRISELYSQHKEQLCISVESHPTQTIVVSCVPAGNFITIREGNYRSRKNSVDLFPSATQKKLMTILPVYTVIYQLMAMALHQSANFAMVPMK